MLIGSCNQQLIKRVVGGAAPYLPALSNISANELNALVLTVDDTGPNDVIDVTYSWQQISGVTMHTPLSNSDKISATVILPKVASAQTATFRVTATAPSSATTTRDVVVTVNPWMGTLYDVTASPYNAAFDGTTDDRAAINTCITDAAATGGSVILPAGQTAYVSDYIDMKSGVRFFGSYTGESSISVALASAVYIYMLGPPSGRTRITDCVIHGLNLSGFGDDFLSSAGSTGISVRGSSGIKIQKIVMPKVPVYGIQGGTIASDTGVAVGNGVYFCTISGRDEASGVAIQFNETLDFGASGLTDASLYWRTYFTPMAPYWGQDGVELMENSVTGCYYGTAFVGVDNGRMENNTVINNTRGLVMQHSNNANIIRNNSVTDNRSAGIHVAFACSDNKIHLNTLTSALGSGEGMLNNYIGCMRNEYVGNTTSCSGGGNMWHSYCGAMSDDCLYDRNVHSGSCSRSYLCVEVGYDEASAGSFTHGRSYGGVGTGYINADMDGVVVKDIQFNGTTSARPLIALTQTITPAEPGGIQYLLTGESVTGCTDDGVPVSATSFNM